MGVRRCALLCGALLALAGCGGGGATAGTPPTAAPAARHFNIVLAASYTPEPGTPDTPLNVPIGVFSTILVQILTQNNAVVTTTIVEEQLTGGACVTVQPQQLQSGEFQITALNKPSCVGQTSTILISDSLGDTYTYNVLVTAL